ncbi:hypothetical protein SNE40_013942 [Patella caerulea]|uniref:WAP domain-containing protein n=1 Tax=Patella caerulea TaxID=87958 RepID=A0AAN8PI33_PATCE
MLLKVLIFTACICLVAEAFQLQRSYYRKKAMSCSTSSECPVGSSCRDANGYILYIREGPHGPIQFLGSNNQGTCGVGAQPSDICDRSSECPAGYECYREMSGYCCPPKRCVTQQYAAERREYWANCRPPTCYYPAK